METTNSLQSVAFDLDGLIANTEDIYEEVVDIMLHGRGKTHDQELRNLMMGRPLLESFRIMVEYHALPDLIEDLAAECRELVIGLMDRSLAPMPGFHDLIDRLDSLRIPFGVATSANREYADDVLNRLGVVKRFQFVLTADDVKEGKPAPDIYLLAAERFGVPAGRMMVLEDSSNGCRAALAAETFAVAVPNRHTRHHDFSGARLVAETLADPRIQRILAG